MLINVWSWSNMNDLARLSFFVSWLILADLVKCQITKGGVLLTSVFRVGDNERLTLDEAFCLRSVKIRAYLTNETFEWEHGPSMRLDITWESDQNVSRLSVESDSQGDDFCDAEHRFSYSRKPVKQNMHTFPDIVNHGPRYIPIKLDCKYVIIPELPHPCLPIKIRYTAPVCLSERICSCRNISLPGPEFSVRQRENGVKVHWKLPKDADVDVEDIQRICISLEPTHSKEYATDFWENAAIRSGAYFFALNSTSAENYVLKGAYENMFQCSGNISQITFKFPELKKSPRDILLYITSYILIAAMTMLLILFLIRKKLGRLLCNKFLSTERQRQTDLMNNNDNLLSKIPFVNNPGYVSDLREKDPYLIDYRQLILEKKLAEGHFGVVYLATSSHSIGQCNVFAVKQLKDTASKLDYDDFLQEMETFKKAGQHKHIVRMIGYCRPPHPLTIVMEYVPFNLLEYLKNVRDEFENGRISMNGDVYRTSTESLPSNYISPDEVEKTPLKGNEKELECILDSQELESFGLQIARGMAHLEERSIIHRDLAARNILVDNHKTLKVSDFGMSRSGIYVNKTNRQFPLRWMSPEAVTYGAFSNKSDVWSYGIVLWEIGTLGGFPYSELKNDQVLSLIRKGGHPHQPESITTTLFRLLLDCWSFKPEDRPTFGDIVKRIEDLRQKAYVDFTELKEYYNFPPTEEDVGDSR